jgi:hypothetical protein
MDDDALSPDCEVSLNQSRGTILLPADVLSLLLFQGFFRGLPL